MNFGAFKWKVPFIGNTSSLRLMAFCLPHHSFLYLGCIWFIIKIRYILGKFHLQLFIFVQIITEKIWSCKVDRNGIGRVLLKQYCSFRFFKSSEFIFQVVDSWQHYYFMQQLTVYKRLQVLLSQNPGSSCEADIPYISFIEERS